MEDMDKQLLDDKPVSSVQGQDDDDDVEEIKNDEPQKLSVSSGSSKSGPRQNPMVTASFLQDKREGYEYFQDQRLNISESVRVHFKPTNMSSCLLMFLMLLDMVLCLVF